LDTNQGSDEDLLEKDDEVAAILDVVSLDNNEQLDIDDKLENDKKGIGDEDISDDLGLDVRLPESISIGNSKVTQEETLNESLENHEVKIVINDLVCKDAINPECDVSGDVFDTSDCEDNANLASLENQNTVLLCENEDQRKVIELIRTELTKKDDDLVKVQEQLANLKETSERNFRLLQNEMNKKVGELKKAFEIANRDKESMVMKYALGEKDILVARKGKEEAEKRLKEANKDKEGFQYKIKTLSTERTRLQALCDNRMQETIAAKKESDKWKEEVKVQESKASSASSRLKAEVDVHRETRETLDSTASQLSEVRGEIDKIKTECSDIVNRHKAEEETIKKRGEMTEKEQSVKLMIDSAAATELEALRGRMKNVVEENNDLSVRVQAAEKERLSYASNLSELKETVNKQRTEIVDLYAKCAELESVKLQLQAEAEKCAAREAEVERLRGEAGELQADMVNCRKKEAELLEFTQKLTDKNVTLQSDFTSVAARAAGLEEEHSRLALGCSRAEASLAEVTAKLEVETSRRREEIELLTGKLAEQTRTAEQANIQVVDARNEVDVLKRRHTASQRELTRELSHCKKRLDQLDSVGVGGGKDLSVSPLGSRTSSSSSLHREETSPQANHLIVNGEKERKERRESSESHHNELIGVMPDTQTLVEKIVKLQRACARRQEKLDFFEEHVQQLLVEIKKKNKVITHYVLSLESGALVSEESDLHKVAMVHQGGIMSSVYSSKPSDSNITLELSLEINKKLQAVLEDTLLKNITLKENMNTLGGEIAKMAMEKNGPKFK